MNLSSSSSPVMEITTQHSVSLDDMPEELKVKIASFVGASSLSDLHSLFSVSKSFKGFSNESKILSVASLDISNLRWNKYPWCQIPEYCYFPEFYMRYEVFAYRCLKAENKHALKTIFEIGLKTFFESSPYVEDDSRTRGLMNIAFATHEGLEGAREWYGVILICMGDRKKGFDLLRPFNISLTPNGVREMESRWKSRATRLWWTIRPSDVVFQFKTTYVREDCHCNGLTGRWFGNPWRGLGRFEELEGMPTTDACEVCLWHAVINILFGLDSY